MRPKSPSKCSQAKLSVGGPAQDAQAQLGANRRVVVEASADGVPAHRSDVDVAPHTKLGKKDADAVGVLASDDSVDDHAGDELVPFLLGR